MLQYIKIAAIMQVWTNPLKYKDCEIIALEKISKFNKIWTENAMIQFSKN